MKPIIFYDGECDVCHRWVKWIIERDAGRVFRFASLQSDFANDLFLHFNEKMTYNSIVIFKNETEFLTKSEAVSFIFSQLNAGSIFYKMLKVFPRFLSDIGYDCISAIRKKIKMRVCPVFNGEEKMLFLNDVDFPAWLSENYPL
ncbi:Predicted thiol-disulfide oxidoreductase YuxK, DCC family [Porphyromonadaceae bacterium KH3R12]|nr:Predicted thiol-disulfide oxidoreductase YuxK, DCC family [Porphyromonadaceae bacterium KH3R12]